MTTNPVAALSKKSLDALLAKLESEFRGTPEYEALLRDAHLGIALSDAGRPYDDQVDPRIADLIRKHIPTT